MTNLSDFHPGDRVTVTGHPDEPATVVATQGGNYRTGYVKIAFDTAPDRPVLYPFRQVIPA